MGEMTAVLDELLSDAQLREVIGRFYNRVYADPVFAPIFSGVEQARQEERLFRFVLMTTTVSGTDGVDGQFLRVAHEHLPITDELVARRWQHLADAIRECGHGEGVVAAWDAYDGRWREWVVRPR